MDCFRNVLFSILIYSMNYSYCGLHQRTLLTNLRTVSIFSKAYCHIQDRDTKSVMTGNKEALTSRDGQTRL